MEIDNIRQKIDETDNHIINLLIQRKGLVTEIAKIKKQNGLQVLDQDREARLIHRVTNISKELDSDFVASLFNLIMENSKKIQEKWK